MAIDANSYGSTAGVAKLIKRYSNGIGDFDEGTDPDKATVEEWIDEVSGQLNVMLADERFSIPIAQADCVRALNSFVNQEVASLVLARHSEGRFGPSAKNPGSPRLSSVSKHVDEFVQKKAGGFAALGAARGTTQTNMGSVSLVRADGYSNDLSATYNSQL